MYYNVVIKDSVCWDDINNQLIFTFYNIKEALEFSEQILNISGYSIEILQIKDDDNE